MSNKTATLDETGHVTTISPGVELDYSQARLDLNLNYSLNAVVNHGLQAEDHQNQSLNLLTQITHKPDQWISSVNARITQANRDIDGIQVVNPINQSSNTEELRTLGISTDYRGRIGRDISFQTLVTVDYADFENQDYTDSAGINLGIDNNRAQAKLNWNAAFSSTVSGTADTDEQIDTLSAGINYRFSRKYATFLRADKSETDNENLNDTSSLLGFTWTPNADSFFSIGAGKRGSDKTWTLDSVIKNKRLTWSMNYSEEVTTSRALVFEQIETGPGLFATSQSLSTIPELIKRGTVALTAQGRRTEFTLSYFSQTRNQATTDSEEEKTDGLSFNANRTLSRLSTVELNVSHQTSQTAQENKINDVQLSYNRQWSKLINFSVELRQTKQTSDVSENEYEQGLLGFRMTATF